MNFLRLEVYNCCIAQPRFSTANISRDSTNPQMQLYQVCSLHLFSTLHPIRTQEQDRHSKPESTKGFATSKRRPKSPVALRSRSPSRHSSAIRSDRRPPERRARTRRATRRKLTGSKRPSLVEAETCLFSVCTVKQFGRVLMVFVFSSAI